MTLKTTTSNVKGITPEGYGGLILNPVAEHALALNPAISTAVPTDSTRFHLPLLEANGAAAWVTEGEEITPDDATLDELVVIPAKVAALRPISSELANDSNPAAQQIVGEAVAQALIGQVDAAFFGNLASPAPAGLASENSVSTVTTALADLDGFAEAIAKAEEAGATVTAFVASATDALTIARLKVSSGSNQPLLGVDATNGTSRSVLGLPLFVSPYVPAGTIWALDGSKQFTVVRNDVALDVDASVYFTSDRVAVRGTIRVGFGFAKPAAIVKLTVGTASAGWTIAVTGTPDAGSYRLIVDGITSDPITHDANAAAVQLALNAIPGVSGATVSGTTTKTITFTGARILSADASALSGGTDPGVTVTAA